MAAKLSRSSEDDEVIVRAIGPKIQPRVLKIQRWLQEKLPEVKETCQHAACASSLNVTMEIGYLPDGVTG